MQARRALGGQGAGSHGHAAGNLREQACGEAGSLRRQRAVCMELDSSRARCIGALANPPSLPLPSIRSPAPLCRGCRMDCWRWRRRTRGCPPMACSACLQRWGRERRQKCCELDRNYHGRGGLAQGCPVMACSARLQRWGRGENGYELDGRISKACEGVDSVLGIPVPHVSRGGRGRPQMRAIHGCATTPRFNNPQPDLLLCITHPPH